MKRLLRRARVLLSVNYAYMLEYRAELLMWALAMALPLIMMGVWVRAGATGRFPMDDLAMARYFIAAFIVRQLSVVWVIYEFEFQVVSGRLSHLLLQPMDPSWRFVTAHLGEQLARLPFAIGLVVLCFVLYPAALVGSDDEPGLWIPNAPNVAMALLAAYCAFALRYLMQYCLSMLAFWLERVGALERLLFLPYLYLSGLIAPLEVFPETARQITLLTPFPYMVWFPAKLLVDGEAPVAAGFGGMGGWAVVLLALNRWLWHCGLKHYSAMGA